MLYISKEYSGLTTLTSSINTLLSDDAIDVYFKLYLLLYADDTVIFAESPEQLQLALDAMLRYCNLWKLSVNTSKTKIVIFSRGKTRNYPEFSFNNKLMKGNVLRKHSLHEKTAELLVRYC